MLNKELIFKKIDQIRVLLGDLAQLLMLSQIEFASDIKTVRSAERNFQLIVDVAIDINSHLLLEQLGKTPDSYRQSFIVLGEAKILPTSLAESLAPTASLRNILVHEYDFEEDYQKFYEAAKTSIPAYEEYCKRVFQFVEEVEEQELPSKK